MPEFLNEDIRKQVGEVFAGLVHPVSILFFGSKVQPCEYCAETRQLLEEVTALSDLISFQAFDLEEDAAIAQQYHVDKAPGFVFAGRDGDTLHDYGVRFYGIPAGHEFTTLINSLLMVSARDSGLSEATREWLAGLKDPLHLQVFVTPT